MAICINPFSQSSALPLHSLLEKVELRAGNSQSPSLSVSSQMKPHLQKESRGRQVWRQRKLIKKDEYLPYKMEHIPFLKEQMRTVKEQGKLLTINKEVTVIRRESV